MLEDPPLISVLLPVFNGGQYLDEAVRSILGQTFSRFEILAADDGSTDDSLRRLRRYAARDPRLRVIARENRGLIYTLNELLSKARGDLIARMDADDVSLPQRFELQVAFLERNPRVVCVGGAWQIIDDAGRYLTTLSPAQSDADIQRLCLRGHTSINHPTAMMRRAAANQVGGYTIGCDLVEDLDLWLRLGEVGELANLPDVLLKYRLHPKSLSETAGQRQREAARRVCESAWSRRNIQEYFEAGDSWRPADDRGSRQKFMLQYGWWAWSSGQRRTAALYGWKAIRARPFATGGWKLLIVALIKSSPVPDG